MNSSFQLIDIIVMIGVFQGVFLSFALQRITDKNREANKILSVLLLIATTMLLGRFLYFRMRSLYFFQFSLLVDSIIFLFGPLLFMYVKTLLFRERRKNHYVFYFLPFVCMLVFSLANIIRYSPQAFYDKNLKGDYNLSYSVITIAGILSNLIYVITSFILLARFRKVENDLFSFKQSLFTYANYTLSSILICLMVWLISYITSTFYSYELPYLNYDTVWMTIPVFIYVIGYFSLKQPGIFRVQLVSKETEKKERISTADAMFLKERLDEIMTREKVYLNSELTLKDISEMAQTSSNNISWLLNNIYKTTFYDFINAYRIAAFVEKVKLNEHREKTLLALSFEVGFNSKSTFNRAFKLALNDTPSNYIKKRLI